MNSFDNSEFSSSTSHNSLPITEQKSDKSFWVFPIIISILIASLCFFGKNIFSYILESNTPQEIFKLSVEHYTNITYIVLFVIMVLLTVILFIVNYKKVSKAPAPNYKMKYKLTIFYIVILILQCMAFTLVILFQNNIISAVRKSSTDIKLFYQDELSTYTGPLLLDEDEIGSNKSFYYIDSQNSTYRIPTNMYCGDQLLQNSYTIRFLPNTNTIIELYDSDMIKHSGTGSFNHPGVDSNHWQYEDLLITKNTQIYGYDKLTEAGQMAFDLMYGEYFYTDELDGTYSFDLPKSINFEEYEKVQQLYWSNNIYYDSNDYRYGTNSTSKENISSMFIRELDNDSSIAEYMKETDRIISTMPENLSEYDQLLFLSRYLVENVEYYNGEDFKAPNNNAESTSEEASPQNDKPYTTGQGALFDGLANCFGYTKAYDTLLRKAGFTTIPVFGQTPNEAHSWNMVLLDGEWFHIDITWMDDDNGYIDYTYFLADDYITSFTHITEKYAYCTSLTVPKANSDKYNWYTLNGLSFESAEQALEYINSGSMPTNQKTQLMLPSNEEYNRLYKYFKQGKAGPIDYYYSEDYYKEPIIIAFAKID